MNYLDLIFGGLMTYGAIRGFSKGLIIEATSLMALIFGLVGSLLFVDVIADFLKLFLSLESIPPKWIIFLIIFISILVVSSILAKFLTKLIKMVFLGTVNKFLGALFGLIKISLILSLIVIILDQFVFLFDFMERNVIKDSFLFDHLKSFGIQIISWFSKNKDILPNEGYDLL